MRDRSIRKGGCSLKFGSLVILLLYFGGPVGEGCGTGTVEESGSNAGTLALTSDDIAEGGTIASTFAHTDCQGTNQSPQLSWSGTIEDVKSYAVTIVDNSFNDSVHWVVYNIPTTTSALARAASLPSGATIGPNDFDQTATYAGPCPDSGTNHTYEFKAWALSIADLSSDANVNVDNIDSVLNGILAHSITSDSFTANYTAP